MGSTGKITLHYFTVAKSPPGRTLHRFKALKQILILKVLFIGHPKVYTVIVKRGREQNPNPTHEKNKKSQKNS